MLIQVVHDLTHHDVHQYICTVCLIFSTSLSIFYLNIDASHGCIQYLYLRILS